VNGLAWAGFRTKTTKSNENRRNSYSSKHAVLLDEPAPNEVVNANLAKMCRKRPALTSGSAPIQARDGAWSRMTVSTSRKSMPRFCSRPPGQGWRRHQVRDRERLARAARNRRLCAATSARRPAHELSRILRRRFGRLHLLLLQLLFGVSHDHAPHDRHGIARGST